jgi:hypothetical protein
VYAGLQTPGTGTFPGSKRVDTGTNVNQLATASVSFRRVAALLCLAETACTVALVARAYQPLVAQRWVQDDAYVSFRYAKHLVEGHGLVYNIGERVEGYTNFLWTLLAAIPLAAGFDDPLPFMHALGV